MRKNEIENLSNKEFEEDIDVEKDSIKDYLKNKLLFMINLYDCLAKMKINFIEGNEDL